MSQSKEHKLRAEEFLAMHTSTEPFILANAWDLGTAKLLCHYGAKAIGTSSSALAFTMGAPDNGSLSLEESIEHAASIAAAVPVPVSADLEHGFGDEADKVYDCIAMAIRTGIAGACIEDVNPQSGVAYDRELALDRIQAALMAIRDHEACFVLTARADGLMHGVYDMTETIHRTQGFEKLGAHVVFVPMTGTREDLAKVASSVRCPVNAIAAGAFQQLTLSEFDQLGVARVSLGSSLARCAQQATIEQVSGIFEFGSFASLRSGANGDEIDQILCGIGG